jgi:hypothetical protein
VTGADLTISDRQFEVLNWIRGGEACSLSPLLENTGVQIGAIACMAKLGLLTVRECGALDPLVRVTALGRELFRARLNADLDPEFDATPTEGGPTMTKTDENGTEIPEAEDVTGKPNETLPTAKPVLDPLYKTLLSETKKASGRGHVVEEKAVYARISQHGRAVAYINHPTTKSVRVEIPQAEGSGYDVVKAAADTDVPAVMALVAARVNLLKERKLAKTK